MSALNLIRELSALLGKEAVEKACQDFLGAKKPKRERKPRGKSSWNLEVDKVLAEMRAGKSAEEAKAVTYKMAYAEASRRRREDNPEAQAKYEANQAKRAEKKGKKAKPAAAPAPPPSEDDEDNTVDGVPARLDPKVVFQYLFELQNSGKTNMLGCKPYLMEEFGMTDAEAGDIRQQLVSHYSEMKAKYGKPATPAAAPTPAKKPAGRPKKELNAARAKIPIMGDAAADE